MTLGEIIAERFPGAVCKACQAPASVDWATITHGRNLEAITIVRRCKCASPAPVRAEWPLLASDDKRVPAIADALGKVLRAA